MNYIINTAEEFDEHLDKFKFTRGAHNINGWLELLDMSRDDLSDLLPEVKEMSGISLATTGELMIFIRHATTLQKINPIALSKFVTTTHRIYTYSMNANYDKEINRRMGDKVLLDELEGFGLPIIRICIPRSHLPAKLAPIDPAHTLVGSYISLFDLYATMTTRKLRARLTYDPFKHSLLKRPDLRSIDILSLSDYVISSKELRDGVMEDQNIWIVDKDQPRVGCADYISLSLIKKLYTAKIGESTIKITSKRQYKLKEK